MVEVTDTSGVSSYPDAVRFATEEDFNNLEVVGSDGSVIAAHNGSHWIAAVISDA